MVRVKFPVKRPKFGFPLHIARRRILEVVVIARFSSRLACITTVECSSDYARRYLNQLMLASTELGHATPSQVRETEPQLVDSSASPEKKGMSGGQTDHRTRGMRSHTRYENRQTYFH